MFWQRAQVAASGENSCLASRWFSMWDTTLWPWANIRGFRTWQDERLPWSTPRQRPTIAHRGRFRWPYSPYPTHRRNRKDCYSRPGSSRQLDARHCHSESPPAAVGSCGSGCNRAAGCSVFNENPDYPGCPLRSGARRLCRRTQGGLEVTQCVGRLFRLSASAPTVTTPLLTIRHQPPVRVSAHAPSPSPVGTLHTLEGF